MIEMSEREPERLLRLLTPVDGMARASARRLCRSNADGDDLYHEAVLRALDRLGDLRDESRFKPWLYRVLLSVHRERTRKSLWRRLLPLEELLEQKGDPPGEDGSRWED